MAECFGSVSKHEFMNITHAQTSQFATDNGKNGEEEGVVDSRLTSITLHLRNNLFLCNNNNNNNKNMVNKKNGQLNNISFFLIWLMVIHVGD